ncbi:MAG: glycosyltransferase [Acidobacteriota bacterium]
MKVAVVSPHPIQYHTPWFQKLAAQEHVDLKVYYALLPDQRQQGVGFGEAFAWDIPLLEGYDWELIPNKRRSPSLRGFFRSSTPAIYSLLARAKPDVVIITGWQALPLLQALWAAIRLGIPRIVRGESNGLRPRPSPVRALHRLLLSRFDAFLAIGKLNREFYLQYGIPDERVFSCPYFVDNDRFAAQLVGDAVERDSLRAGWNIDDGRPATEDRPRVCFLFAGKLEPKKRIMDLLRAMDVARRKCPSIHLLVAGAGELMDEARQFAESRSLPVTFAGFLNQSQITRAYAAADCLVLPSDHGETWGLVVNEAMACGLPAIVSDQAGCGPDLVEEGVTGGVFPCGDINALALKIQAFASDPEQLARMGEQARQRINNYSVERAVQGTMRALEFVTSAGRRTTDDGRETTGDGRRTTDDGRRVTGDGRLTTDDGRRTTEDGGRTTVHRHLSPVSGRPSVHRHLSPVSGRSSVVGPRSSLRVLHVIPSMSSRDGGPSFAMPLIARGLQRAGVVVDVATTVGDQEAATLGADLDGPVRSEGVSYFNFRRQSEFYKVSFPLSKWLSAHVRDYDLVHIHALFSYSSYAAATLAAKNGVPYIVRPLGVLNRWGMQNRRRLLKRLSFRFIEQRIIRNAAAIHYTSQQEKLEAEEAGVRNQSVVIPLAVDLSGFRELGGPERFYEKFPRARGNDIILFLSRLDPKKGLDLLLRAFATDNRRRTTGDGRRTLLVIAGEGDAQFVEGLRRLAEELRIADAILWTGFLDGEDKLSAMAAASLFVLPSYSENFGIALVEAMAAGLPCVMSDQVGIAVDAKEYDAGLVAPCEAGLVASAMRRLIDDPELRGRLGANARRLADDRFSVEAMTDSLVKLYDRVLSRATGDRRPETGDRGKMTVDRGQTTADRGPESARRPSSVVRQINQHV